MKKIILFVTSMAISSIIGISTGYFLANAQQNIPVSKETKVSNSENTLFEKNNSLEESIFSQLNTQTEENMFLSSQILSSNQTTRFELPINNSMGFSLIPTQLIDMPNDHSNIIKTLNTGETFLIKEEVGEWLLVELNTGEVGYISIMNTMINLPDIVPSIIYNVTNSYGSLFRSSGKEIPNVTGLGFYQGIYYNERLGKNEFILPVLYPMAQKIYNAQQLALKQGDTLIIYEGYRPYDLQNLVYEELTRLSKIDPEVMSGMKNSYWHINWFIAKGISTHQIGLAIDVSLAKINKFDVGQIGEHLYFDITAFEEYTMPSPIHELSTKAVSMKTPVAWQTPFAWQAVEISETMTEGAKKLREYCTGAGLEPLASEWWHFNDVPNTHKLGNVPAHHSIKPQECISQTP
ncbi:hypothetical protein AN639_01490 [Candidatus Epulonipiscium fishelsonii]|uniref:Uncharacterized protein n=1 Tax=Candidatus Epulonipiscium fishelsonii TaxID=77094 RepID=A0ACC8XBT1_9FIRM|nr:hypothetical protein AN639_01490 [Epulopiscium sp. SCG-B05WGA-EpuloA1]ONI39997.1 hypothetical protein AN396_06515 [Epulopiscium sp. SCG-B11WGA-EpuloA1]